MPLKSFKFFPESFSHSVATHPKPFIFSNILVSFTVKAKHWNEGENKIGIDISKFLFSPHLLKIKVNRYFTQEFWLFKIHSFQYHLFTENLELDQCLGNHNFLFCLSSRKDWLYLYFANEEIKTHSPQAI